MAEILVGEKVQNKARKTGTIVSFDGSKVSVDFQGTVTNFLPDAFEKGFLRYVNASAQDKINEAQIEAEQRINAIRAAREKAEKARQKMQTELSKIFHKILVLEVRIRLDPAPITWNSVREKDQDLVKKLFAEADRDAEELYGSITPDIGYSVEHFYGKAKYCVAFLCKYLDTYVFRVFSRNDVYSRTADEDITVESSDVTEVLRVFRVNDKTYCFSKNLAVGANCLINTSAHENWHVSKLDSTLMLNEVIKKCDCGYLNDYIEDRNINCLQYAKLLMPAFYNNKVEIVFKHKIFMGAYRIANIEAYLAEFTHKQIDYVCKYNALNTLPIVKRYGALDPDILRHMESIMKKKRRGYSIFTKLEGYLSRLGEDCSDLDQKLIRFLKRVEEFNPALYFDYIDEISNLPGVTVRDYFDRNYFFRHYTMVMERQVRYTKREFDAYCKEAKALSWIDREENGYFIIIPKTIEDFKDEGDMQHNCVYTNRYYRDVIHHDSIIVFLRKEKHKSFVTIEYDYETFEVLQALGKYNTSIDPQLYQYVVDLGKRLHYKMHSLQ